MYMYSHVVVRYMYIGGCVVELIQVAQESLLFSQMPIQSTMPLLLLDLLLFQPFMKL